MVHATSITVTAIFRHMESSLGLERRKETRLVVVVVVVVVGGEPSPAVRGTRPMVEERACPGPPWWSGLSIKSTKKWTGVVLKSVVTPRLNPTQP
jgi:hypothetical protein